MSKDLRALLEKIQIDHIPLEPQNLKHLSDMPVKEAELFASTWPTLAIPRRREIMRHLADICQTDFEVDFTPIALMGIDDQDSLVRLAALDTFWDTESPDLIKPLLNLVQNDQDVTVQASAAQSLGQLVLIGELGQISQHLYEHLTGELLAIWHDLEKALLVRCRVLESLAATSLDEIPGFIGDAYGSGEHVLKISAIAAMGRSADPQWEPIILAEMESVEPSIRYQAVEAAGKLELQTAVPLLIELVEDPDPEVALASIWALGEIGGQRAREALEALLDDEDLAELVENALEVIALGEGMSPSLL